MKFLTSNEAADRLGMCRAQLYNRVKQGLMKPPIKDGRRAVWPESDVDQYQRAIMADRDAGLRLTVDERVKRIQSAVAA